MKVVFNKVITRHGYSLASSQLLEHPPQPNCPDTEKHWRIVAFSITSSIFCSSPTNCFSYDDDLCQSSRSTR